MALTGYTKTGRTKAVSGVYSSTEDLLRLRYLAQDLTLVTRRNSRALINGAQRTHFRGRGMEFAEVRAYQAGDDIRNIDWRVTARTGSPHTKLFQEERERPVYVMVDLRSPMFFGSRRQFKSVLATELAAIIGWTAQANNDRIGGLLFGDLDQCETRARRGKHAVLELLHQLLVKNHALANPTPRREVQELTSMLTDLRRVTRPGSSVFLIGDFHDFDESCREPMAMLTRHCDAALLHIYDLLEKQLPAAGTLPVSDGRTQRLLNTGSRQLRQDFARRFAQHQQRLQDACTAAAMPFVSVSTEASAEDVALDLFAARHQQRRSSRLGLGGIR